MEKSSSTDREELRKKSRHAYLKTRKETKVRELEEALRDEDYLFVKLTKREQEENKLKRYALNLAREHEKAQEIENINRYREDNRFPEPKASG